MTVLFSAPMSDGKFDPHRRLCPDGACIGVIGDDGRCKVCRMPARAPDDEADEDEDDDEEDRVEPL